ncbi:hypothetical protein KF913_26600, partial [Candidatus Obscuribacterales bacterium]|nr:hypothetical protein [Candidatus Obscuribacterales bacterium]
MMSRFRKPLTWVVAQSILALSLPLAALAAPSEDMTSNGFELPINDVLLVDETRTASAEASTSTFASPLASPSTPVETLPQAAPQAVTPTNNTDEPEMVGALESAKARAIAQKVDSEPGAVLEIEDIVSKNELSPPLMGGVESNNVDQEVIVIDNDEFQLAGTDEVWQELKDEPGMTKISAGAQFPVVVVSSLNSKHNQIGDPLEARLKTDIKIGGKLIAKKGDRVVGHVSSCSKARKMLHAEMSTKRWMRANGAIGLQFDEIVTESGEHLPLVAKPAKRARIVKNINE